MDDNRINRDTGLSPSDNVLADIIREHVEKGSPNCAAIARIIARSYANRRFPNGKTPNAGEARTHFLTFAGFRPGDL